MGEKDSTPATPAKADVRRTVEEWRDERSKQGQSYPGGWNAASAYSIARAHNGWAVGKLLTEAEYDAAIKAALNVSVR